MAEQAIRFDDGAAYERMMGVWSALAGDVFLDWLAPPSGLRWIDVGCGNGAFTQRIAERCAPASLLGIDPSEAQLAFARSRPVGGLAEFRVGDAMALAVPAASYDAAVMALVITLVPDPAKGTAEMARAVAPGGFVAAYIWDFPGGGFPFEPILAPMRAMGLSMAPLPRADAAGLAALEGLWTGAGLTGIETRVIVVERTFASFEDFWETGVLTNSVRIPFQALAPAEGEKLKARVRENLRSDAAGRLTLSGRANAIKGRVPGR